MIGTWFFGNVAWILALVNFIWMLVKNTSLFSWYWVIGAVIGFVVSFVGLCIGIIKC